MIYIVAGILVIAGVILAMYVLLKAKEPVRQMHAFYEYDASLYAKKDDALDFETQSSDIFRMNREVFRVASRAKMSEGDMVSLYAQLAVAHHEMIALSSAVTGDVRVGIAPVTKKIVCATLPDLCGEMRFSANDIDSFDDVYTTRLTDAVYEKMRDPQSEKYRDMYMFDTAADMSLDTESIESILSNELETVRQTLSSLTYDQKRAAIFWSGGIGTKGVSGIWLLIVSEYADKANLSLLDHLKMRATAMIAAHDSYFSIQSNAASQYNVSPHDFDKTIIPVLPDSSGEIQYPDQNAAMVSAIVSIMTTYISGSVADDLQEERQEALDSRVWSGARLPLSVQKGIEIGAFVSESIRNKK